jgi:general secretion pathway protein A
MLLEYYGLKEQPFHASPDSRYLYPSETHREALASLLYGVESGCGFMTLIAEPGMGKTMLLFQTLSQLKGKTKTAFIFQSISSREEFLRAVLQDLGIKGVHGGIEQLQAGLIGLLLDMATRGERLVIVVDEAQNLDNSILEFVRMLSNFEATQHKLMHIILCGQPELARKLMSPDLRQLRQRIVAVAKLRPLTRDETAGYIEHRLRATQKQRQSPLFTPAALRAIADHCEGIPRMINIICFNALSLGYATKQRVIDRDVIQEVIADLDLETVVESPGANPEPWPAQEPKKTHRLSVLRGAMAKMAISAALLALPAHVLGRQPGKIEQAGQPVHHFASLSSREIRPKQPRPIRTSLSLRQSFSATHGRKRQHHTRCTMSRNFELMNELSGDTWLRSSGQVAPARTITQVVVEQLEAPQDQDEVSELVQRVFLMRPDNPPRVVVFAGVSPDTGLERICSAVGQCLVKNIESKVCVVDAETKNELQNRRMEEDADELLDQGSILYLAKPLNQVESLWKIPLGNAARDTSGRIVAGKLRTYITKLRTHFDFVIVQAPQLGRYVDSRVLGQLADGIVLVLEAGATRKEAAQAAITNLRASNVEVLGAILNNRTYPIPGPIYKRL